MSIINEISVGDGLKPGKMLSFGVADGRAHYIVTKVLKDTVEVVDIPLGMVIVIKDNVIDTVTPCTKDNCEKVFLNTIKENISNFDEYDQEDIQAILDDGYETFGHGSVNLTWILI